MDQKVRKAAYSIILIYFTVRAALLFTGYAGNSDLAWSARVLVFFTPDDVSAGLEYLRAAFGFRWLALAWLALYFAACSFTAATARSYERAFAIRRGGEWSAIAAYFADFGAGLFVSQLPFSWVTGHVREKAFGFSNLDTAGWLALQLKFFAVTLALGIAIVFVAKLALERTGGAYHIALPAAAAGLGLALLLALQAIVIPAFYETAELADKKLADALISIASSAGVTVNKIEQIDESRYSNHTNAFFTGFGPWKRIFLCDTLVRDHPPAEVEIVYGHELGHYFHNHEFKGVMIAAAAVLLLGLALKARERMSGRAPAKLLSAPAVRDLPLFIFAYMAFAFFALPVENLISRHFEREADAFTITRVASPRGTLEEYEKMNIRLARGNRSNLLPHPLNQFWFGTHPPAVERLEAAAKARR